MSALSLRDVAADLGISYESARQLALGAAGDPLPALRTSARPGARWIVPDDAYRAWKERQLAGRAVSAHPRSFAGDGEMHLETLATRRERYQAARAGRGA